MMTIWVGLRLARLVLVAEVSPRASARCRRVAGAWASCSPCSGLHSRRQNPRRAASRSSSTARRRRGEATQPASVGIEMMQVRWTRHARRRRSPSHPSVGPCQIGTPSAPAPHSHRLTSSAHCDRQVSPAAESCSQQIAGEQAKTRNHPREHCISAKDGNASQEAQWRSRRLFIVPGYVCRVSAVVHEKSDRRTTVP